MADFIPTTQKILTTVEKSKSGLTAGQIASRAKLNEKTVKNLLPIMARSGLIEYS